MNNLNEILYKYYEKDIVGGFPIALIPLATAFISSLPGLISSIRGSGLKNKDKKNINEMYKLIKYYKSKKK